jgi:signal transduction histidine kinase
LPAPIKVDMPYDEDIATNPIIKDLWHAIETGENGLNKTYKEKDKNDYYCYEAKYNPTLIPESVTELQLEAESWTTTFASEKNSIVGFDSWSGQLTTTEDFQILIRFAKVFEQAYTRFLDLQKAEAQAREASLERIRSRAMAMNTSEELNTLIGFIYVECTKLNMHLDRGFIMTFNKATKDTHWWMVSADASDKPLKILVKYHEYAPNLAILKGWEERQQRWSYVLEGNNKKTWDDYQFANDLSQLPDFVKDNMRSVKSVILNASFQNFSCIMLSSFEPLSEDHFDLLMRLSKVFDLTYTRFLDLQLREQNAIRLIEEKEKLEFTLSELRATQAQLIQSEKLASLGELTAGIAHEIQNPLNFVNNFSEMSIELAKELDEEIDKEVMNKELVKDLVSDLSQNQQKINHHGKRASSIVSGMLEHSRTSTGERVLTDINKLADEYLRLSYHGIRAKDNAFNSDYKTDFDENLPKIEVIPQDMGRVLLNLINNAFWATNQRNLQGFKNLTGLNDYSPTVTISTQRSDNQIILKVIDNGIGMSEATKAKIFQPFFTTKPTGQGTGLGLSLAYDIVTKGHGGTIEVESVEGEGTTFVVKLPL